MFFIGIDAGITGAVAILRDGQFRAVHDMPLCTKGTGRREVNAPALARMLSNHQPHSIIAGIEKVSAMPGQGVSSTFSFGDSFGVARGVCGALLIPVQYVVPATWKRAFGLIGAEKDASRGVAAALFPEADLRLKKHHNRADALLVAYFMFKNYREVPI